VAEAAVAGAAAAASAAAAATEAGGPRVIHTLLPDQYLEGATARVALPQRRLMIAVLQTVIDDVQGSAQRRAAGYPIGVDRREVERAREYVASTDRSWPFSFENVCEAVGLDASRLRSVLEDMLFDAPDR